MFWFLFTILCSIVDSRCIWKSPETMFPQALIRLKVDYKYFKPRRRLRKVIYQIKKEDEESRHVITGVTEEKNSELSRHDNAVRGKAYYSTNNFTGALDDRGTVYYSIVFDKRFAADDVLYNIVGTEPAMVYTSEIDLTENSDEITLIRFKHETSEALQFVDEIKIWLGVSPQCLPDYQIGRVPYDFDVRATYDLYHGYKNQLLVNDTSVTYTSQGWIGKASIMMHPSLHYMMENHGQVIGTPCGAAWISSSMQTLNTSQFTYFDKETRSYEVNKEHFGKRD